MAPRDVWIMIDGYERRVRHVYESTRAICHTIAQYSGRQMKNPNIPVKAFWPLPWDENGNDELVELVRARKKRDKK
jgi:hypothetical protein